MPILSSSEIRRMPPETKPCVRNKSALAERKVVSKWFKFRWLNSCICAKLSFKISALQRNKIKSIPCTIPCPIDNHFKLTHQSARFFKWNWFFLFFLVNVCISNMHLKSFTYISKQMTSSFITVNKKRLIPCRKLINKYITWRRAPLKILEKYVLIDATLTCRLVSQHLSFFYLLDAANVKKIDIF